MINDLGGLGVMRKWFQGGVDKDIIKSHEEARNDLISSILQVKQNNHHEIDLLITHDWNIILLKDILFDVFSSDFKWPEFMEGVIVKIENEKITLNMTNKERMIYINSCK